MPLQTTFNHTGADNLLQTINIGMFQNGLAVIDHIVGVLLYMNRVRWARFGETSTPTEYFQIYFGSTRQWLCRLQ